MSVVDLQSEWLCAHCDEEILTAARVCVHGRICWGCNLRLDEHCHETIHGVRIAAWRRRR